MSIFLVFRKHTNLKKALYGIKDWNWKEMRYKVNRILNKIHC